MEKSPRYLDRFKELMMVNPYHWFHRKLMNNRWIREDENNWQAPPSNRDMIIGGSGFIVIIAVFAFVCLNNVIYIGFSKNPTVLIRTGSVRGSDYLIPTNALSAVWS